MWVPGLAAEDNSTTHNCPRIIHSDARIACYSAGNASDITCQTNSSDES